MTVTAFCICMGLLACHKNTPAPVITPYWPTKGLAGKFAGTGQCTADSNTADTIIVTAIDSNHLNISGIYASSLSFTATLISDTSYSIQPRIYTNENGNTLVQGTAIMPDSNTINLSLIITTTGQESRCSSVLTRI